MGRLEIMVMVDGGNKDNENLWINIWYIVSMLKIDLVIPYVGVSYYIQFIQIRSFTISKLNPKAILEP